MAGGGSVVLAGSVEAPQPTAIETMTSRVMRTMGSDCAKNFPCARPPGKSPKRVELTPELHNELRRVCRGKQSAHRNELRPVAALGSSAG